MCIRDSFNNFDEVMDAWDTQIRYYTRKSIEIEYVVDTMLEENVHDILCSALVDDCIERAKSIKQGGAKYDWVSGLQVGIANLGNSLAAVKKLVFEQGAIGQQQLAAALADDFDGLTHEQLRQRLINGAPKYGNDDDRADEIGVWLLRTFLEMIKKRHTYRNSEATTSILTITSNVVYGKYTGALPDGRAAFTPFAPGATPSYGAEQNGLLASLNSVAKLPYHWALDGISNTQTINPEALGHSEGERVENLVQVLDGYFDQGAHHLNVNVFGKEKLLDAMEHPEKEEYANFTIRVSGYAVKFIDLTREQQLDVLARTCHGAL